MQFSSITEFIAMGGHGFYVWLSYGISFLLLSFLVFSSLNKNKAIIQQIRQRQQREAKLKQAAQQQNANNEENP